jgi:hypothetical protein
MCPTETEKKGGREMVPWGARARRSLKGGEYQVRMKADPGGEEKADVQGHVASWIKTHTTAARNPLWVG